MPFIFLISKYLALYCQYFFSLNTKFNLLISLTTGESFSFPSQSATNLARQTTNIL